MSGPQYTYGRAHHPIPPPRGSEEDDVHWTPEAIAERNRQLRETNAKLNAEYARRFPAVWGERAFPDASRK